MPHVFLRTSKSEIVANCNVLAGHRIQIEVPLLRVGSPPQRHAANCLFVYHKFKELPEAVATKIRELQYDAQSRVSKGIRQHLSQLKRTMDGDRFSNPEWKLIEKILCRFEANCMRITYTDETHYSSETVFAGESGDYHRDLGKAVYEFASRLAHSCSPNCMINVIDERGAIEIRAIREIKHGEVLTRNKIEDFDLWISSTSERQLYLQNQFNFKCNCVRCMDWDMSRGFQCCGIPFDDDLSDGEATETPCPCSGGVWSCPPYLVWKCRKCERLVPRESLSHLFAAEKDLAHRLKGIEQILDHTLSFDIESHLYNLVNDASDILAPTHWIFVRLLWICFEHRYSQSNLESALIYLKRHIELITHANDENLRFDCKQYHPHVADKFELLADLMSETESYKVMALNEAYRIRMFLLGPEHQATKRVLKKLALYQSDEMIRMAIASRRDCLPQYENKDADEESTQQEPTQAGKPSSRPKGKKVKKNKNKKKKKRKKSNFKC